MIFAQERVTLMVAFPNEYVGRVIGKGGVPLKLLVQSGAPKWVTLGCNYYLW